jgi:hypothetical protein
MGWNNPEEAAGHNAVLPGVTISMKLPLVFTQVISQPLLPLLLEEPEELEDDPPPEEDPEEELEEDPLEEELEDDPELLEEVEV